MRGRIDEHAPKLLRSYDVGLMEMRTNGEWNWRRKRFIFGTDGFDYLGD